VPAARLRNCACAFLDDLAERRLASGGSVAITGAGGLACGCAFSLAGTQHGEPQRARLAQLPADESGTYGAARGKWRARARRAGALQLALRRCFRQTRARLGEVLSTPRTPFPWRGLWAARRGGNRPPAVKKRPEAGTNSLVASLAFSDKDLPFTGPDIARAQAEHFAAAQRWSWPRAPNRSTIGRTGVTWTSGAWRARRKQRRTV
jgi:hypothetical protein